MNVECNFRWTNISGRKVCKLKPIPDCIELYFECDEEQCIFQKILKKLENEGFTDSSIREGSSNSNNKKEK